MAKKIFMTTAKDTGEQVQITVVQNAKGIWVASTGSGWALPQCYSRYSALEAAIKMASLSNCHTKFFEVNLD